jgi:TolB-like protein
MVMGQDLIAQDVHKGTIRFATRLVVTCLALVFSLLSAGSAAADFKKTKVAVLDFELQGEGFETTDMGEIVSEWLITALVQEGRFDVVERRLLKKLMEEQKLVMTGIVDANSATELGKLLGVTAIISGSVMRVQNVIEVNARIIDVESGSIAAAESVRSTTAIQLEELIGQMAEKIIRDFPLQGYVVHRDKNTILIDLGRQAGVKRGMRFIVFKEGNVIKHPKTGEVLDVEKIQTGMAEVKKVDEKTAQAEILEEKGTGTIEYGDMVKNVVEPIAAVAPVAAGRGWLHVNTDPTGAQVRILNIGPPYRDGIELASGRYHVEVSADGYATRREWVFLGAGEDKRVTVHLDRSEEPVSISKPVDEVPKSRVPSKLVEVNSVIEEAERLKEAGNYRQWEIKIKEALVMLERLLSEDPNSPQVWFYYAKAYYAADNIRKTYKCLEKALYFDPGYMDALVFKGDISYDQGKKIGPGRRRSKYEALALEAYRGAVDKGQGKSFEAMMYFKIGNVYAELSNDKERAKEYWQKAASTAPSSEAAQLARQRL